MMAKDKSFRGKYEMTPMANIEDIKVKIRPTLRRYSVRRAAIFGSYARRQEKEGSDIDIVVEMDDSKGLLDFVSLKLDLEELLGIKVDLASYGCSHPRIMNSLLRDQVTVI